MVYRLLADERRRVELVLEAAAATDSLARLLVTTLDALDEHLGYSESAFMLTLAEPRLPGHCAYAAVAHGQHSPPQCRFVDDFLRRIRLAGQLSHRLPVGWSEGYLTLMGPEDHGPRDECLIEELAPGLIDLLRARLPIGLDAGLSTREAQVAELVTLGFSNREIADVLHLEEDTIKKHVSRVLARLGMRRRSELAAAWATGHRMDLPFKQGRQTDSRSSVGSHE